MLLLRVKSLRRRVDFISLSVKHKISLIYSESLLRFFFYIVSSKQITVRRHTVPTLCRKENLKEKAEAGSLGFFSYKTGGTKDGSDQII
jgi:hypothetical protein